MGKCSCNEHTKGVDVLLNEKETSKIIGFSVKWLQKDRLKKEPVIAFTRIGRTVRYKLSNITKFVNQ